MKVAQSGAPTTTITDASSTVYRGSDLRLLLDVTDGRAESGGAGEPLWHGEGATGRQSGGGSRAIRAGHLLSSFGLNLRAFLAQFLQLLTC